MTAALTAAISRHPSWTLAVDGSVDSMTLANVAHSVLGRCLRMFHAMSSAAPPVISERVRMLAARKHWRPKWIDAGELGDARYRTNPKNPCYFPKTNLYATIAEVAQETIVPGTNCDDLCSIRPGLKVAQLRWVVHLSAAAEMKKPAAYTLTSELALADLASLPAQLCLASRVDTGLTVHADDLEFVDANKTLLPTALGTSAIVRLLVTDVGGIFETQRDHPPASEAEACLASGQTYLGHLPCRQSAAFPWVQP